MNKKEMMTDSNYEKIIGEQIKKDITKTIRIYAPSILPLSTVRDIEVVCPDKLSKLLAKLKL